MTSSVKLFIADANRLFREGIRRILERRGLQVVGESRSLTDIAEDLRTIEDMPDLLLYGPSNDPEREFATMKRITQEFLDLKVVILADQDAAWGPDRAVDAGAVGFLPKDISADALIFSLELISLGEQIFSTARSTIESKNYRPQPESTASTSAQSPQLQLSVRESQILSGLVNGLPNKEIAKSLGMAEAAIKVHLKSLLRKINARNRTQAAIWGMHNISRERTANHTFEYSSPTDQNLVEEGRPAVAKVRYASLQKSGASGSSSITTKAVKSADGEIVTVYAIDADSQTFADDLTYVFRKNVERATGVGRAFRETTQPRDIVLSAREAEILACLVDGLPNKTIARYLDMAEATVKVHLKSLLRKINAQNRTQAALWGLNHPSFLPDNDNRPTGAWMHAPSKG